MKIPVMNDKLTFDDAFKFARAIGASRFEWRGKRYTTDLRSECAARETVPVGERILEWKDE